MSQEIKVQVIGITHMKGKSKKNGSDYEFSQIDYLRTAKPHFKNDTTEIKKAGFEVKQIGCTPDPAVFSEFCMMPFGQLVTLVLQPDPDDIQKSICVGFKRDEQKKAI